jgi:hypothetical protein
VKAAVQYTTIEEVQTVYEINEAFGKTPLLLDPVTVLMSSTGLLRCFQLAYWLMKEKIANRKFGSLRALLGRLGLQALDVFKRKNASYTSGTFFTSMLSALSLWWKRKARALRTDSFFSVLIDESTDVSTVQQLIIYVRFVVAGVALTTFLSLEPLDRANAETITAVVLQLLLAEGLSLEKVRPGCTWVNSACSRFTLILCSCWSSWLALVLMVRVLCVARRLVSTSS